MSFLALLRFGTGHGHYNIAFDMAFDCQVMLGGVPKHYSGNLGHWLCKQRRAWRSFDGNKLTADERQLLQMLVDKGKLHLYSSNISVNLLMYGVIYVLVGMLEMDNAKALDKASGLNWKISYGALLVYGQENGHYNISTRECFKCEVVIDGIAKPLQYEGKLGYWLHRQRQSWKGSPWIKILATDERTLLQVLVDEGTVCLHFTQCYITLTTALMTLGKLWMDKSSRKCV